MEEPVILFLCFVSFCWDAVIFDGLLAFLSSFLSSTVSLTGSYTEDEHSFGVESLFAFTNFS